KRGVPYLWHSWENACMNEQAIRTTVDIPASLYRKLKEQAAAQGRSIRELILLRVRVTLLEGTRPRAKRVRFPLRRSVGPREGLADDRVAYRSEPEAIEPEFRRQSRLGTSSPKVWADSYLLAFATVAGLKLVTFDRALRSRASEVLVL